MKQKNEYTDVLVELEKRGVVYSVVSYFVGLEVTDIEKYLPFKGYYDTEAEERRIKEWVSS